jgi:hypothetical protein
MEIALADLQDGVRRASAEVVKVLRTEPDVQAVTPGGEWTVRETAVHLICERRTYTILLEGRPSRFQTSFDFSAWNSALFLAMDEDHPSVLANLVEDAISRPGPGRRRRKQMVKDSGLIGVGSRGCWIAFRDEDHKGIRREVHCGRER